MSFALMFVWLRLWWSSCHLGGRVPCSLGFPNEFFWGLVLPSLSIRRPRTLKCTVYEVEPWLGGNTMTSDNV